MSRMDDTDSHHILSIISLSHYHHCQNVTSLQYVKIATHEEPSKFHWSCFLHHCSNVLERIPMYIRFNTQKFTRGHAWQFNFFYYFIGKTIRQLFSTIIVKNYNISFETQHFTSLSVVVWDKPRLNHIPSLWKLETAPVIGEKWDKALLNPRRQRDEERRTEKAQE